MHEHGIATELVAKLPDHGIRIRARPVHLVDESDTGHVVTLHLAVDRDRLRLDTSHGTQNEHGTIEHAKAPLNLDGEINVARRIDQVDSVSLPLDRSGGTGDGDPSLLFQIHVVHCGAFAADFLDTMNSPGVEKDPLAQGCFARVDVSRNTDIVQVSQRVLHDFHIWKSGSCTFFHRFRTTAGC